MHSPVYKSVFYDRETWWKTRVEFDAAGREVSYDLVKGFEHLAHLSAVSPDHMVTVPNIPFFSGAARMKDADELTLWAFQVYRTFNIVKI